MASGLLMAALVASIWAIGNGVLHDAFVLARHEGPYTRELLRLLMDGHILITCGVVYVVAYFLIKQGNALGPWLCCIAAASLIVYCAMIFPFLKSFGTVVINVVVLGMAVFELITDH